jgi:hypothetical protein
MCGAAHGPDHDDPQASSVCDLYHGFGRADLPRLEAALSHHEKELLWQLALGVGPEGLARRFGSEPDAVRGDLAALEGRLREMV